ncbi:MAG: hypothetical protein WCH76_07455 [Candidatus Riflemargulisbacteria bacterium]
MYKILCLTTGSNIRWPRDYQYPTQKMIPNDIVCDIAHFRDTAFQQGIIYFNTKEHADWFVRRRLSWNPRRTDQDKLSFMNAVFKASEMADVHFSKKHQFLVQEC